MHNCIKRKTIKITRKYFTQHFYLKHIKYRIDQ